MISSKNESIEEIKHKLLSTRLELIAAKMESNAEIRKYEETVKRLYNILKIVCQERDEARDQLQLLIRKFQPSTQVDHTNQPSCDLSLSSLQSNDKKISSMDSSNTRIGESCNLALPKQTNHQNKYNMVDNDSLVIEKLVCGKPLPQKGKLLQKVTEIGPLLHTLLLDPVPQWKNPPPLCSSSLSLSSIHKENYLSTNSNDKESVNPNEFVPTSLSLAFPGNSNEPMSFMDSNGMHNHTIAGKKRKFL